MRAGFTQLTKTIYAGICLWSKLVKIKNSLIGRKIPIALFKMAAAITQTELSRFVSIQCHIDWYDREKRKVMKIQDAGIMVKRLNKLYEKLRRKLG